MQPQTEAASAPSTPTVALGAGLALSAAGYWLIRFLFPLAGNTSRLADIRTFLPEMSGGLAYLALLAGLFALLLWLHRLVIASDWKPAHSLAFVLLAALLLALPLLWTYPYNSTDIFRYTIRGRISSLYGQNPYAVSPSALADDDLAALAGEWIGETSPYGPVWEMLAAALTSLGGGDLQRDLLLFKLTGVASLLATTSLIWLTLGDVPARIRSAYALLWAWNPAILLVFVANGHNEAFMLLWLLLGYLLIRRGRPYAGFLALFLAVLTKPIALLVLPVFFLAQWRRFASHRQRVLFASFVVIAGLSLAWLSFLPWAGRGELMASPVDLGLRLVREASDVAGFSPPVLAYFALESAGLEPLLSLIGQVARALFALFLAWVLWQTWRGRQAVKGAADVFLGYFMQALSFRIWYAAWPFPWLLIDGGDHALVSESRRDSRSAAYRLRAGLWLLFTTQASVIVYGHLRTGLLDGSQPAAHLLGVPLTLGLPWLLALLPIGPAKASDVREEPFTLLTDPS